MHKISIELTFAAAFLFLINLTAGRTVLANETDPQAESDAPSALKRAKVFTLTGGTLTAVGGLGTLAGLGVGVAALYYYADLGPGDTAAVFGIISLATIGVGLPFLAAGISLLVAGKRKRARVRRMTTFLPTPVIGSALGGSTGMAWQFTF